MEPRLDTLETKMMSAEDQLDALNRTVWEQRREIDLLREQFRQMAEQLRALLRALPSDPEDELPPHY